MKLLRRRQQQKQQISSFQKIPSSSSSSPSSTRSSLSSISLLLLCHFRCILIMILFIMGSSTSSSFHCCAKKSFTRITTTTTTSSSSTIRSTPRNLYSSAFQPSSSSSSSSYQRRRRQNYFKHKTKNNNLPSPTTSVSSSLSSSSLFSTFQQKDKQQQLQQNIESSSSSSQPMPSLYDPYRPYFQIYYNDVYKVDLPPNHRFPMKKYEQVRKLVQERIVSSSSSLSTTQQEQEQETVQCDFQISPLATFEELATTHSKEYIQRFMHGQMTSQELRNVGFPWSIQGVKRATSSVGGTMGAACTVCDRLQEQKQYEQQQQEQQQSSSSQQQQQQQLVMFPPWAAHIAGGTHHAFYDYGEGFSVFSDIAVAANVVLERYRNVISNNILIIDLDVHQGNGNAVLFQNNPNVFTFSMHCIGNYFSTKQHSDLDIELPIDCNDATYLMTLHHWLNQFSKMQQQQQQEPGQDGNIDNFDDHHHHLTATTASSLSSTSRTTSTTTTSARNKKTMKKIDLIFFQAGVDVLQEDRLGRMNLTQKGVERRNELVYEFAYKLKVPLVICMGGGYPRRNQKQNNKSNKSNNHEGGEEDDPWKPILEAHANVYCQAYTFLQKKYLELKKEQQQQNVDDAIKTRKLNDANT